MLHLNVHLYDFNVNNYLSLYFFYKSKKKVKIITGYDCKVYDCTITKKKINSQFLFSIICF